MYDHRGIGESDVPPYPYTIEMLSQDLLDILDTMFFSKDNPLPHVDLFGISMGGVIAQYASIISPHKVRKIILGCTTHGGPSTKLGRGMISLSKSIKEKKNSSQSTNTQPLGLSNISDFKVEKIGDQCASNDQINRDTLEVINDRFSSFNALPSFSGILPNYNNMNGTYLNETIPFTDSHPLKDRILVDLIQYGFPEDFYNDPLCESFYGHMKKQSRTVEGIRNQFNAIMRFNLEKRVGTMNQDILIIHGDQDNIVPLSSGKLLNQNVRKSKLHILKGAGHFFWITHQVETYEQIEKFLKKQQKSML